MLRLPAPLTIDPIPSFEIRRVTDEASAEDWESVLVDGFPVPELQPFRAGFVLPAHALAAPGWRHWVGYLDSQAVATASVYVGEHHVDIEYVSTREHARGRGMAGPWRRRPQPPARSFQPCSSPLIWRDPCTRGWATDRFSATPCGPAIDEHSPIS